MLAVRLGRMAVLQHQWKQLEEGLAEQTGATPSPAWRDAVLAADLISRQRAHAAAMDEWRRAKAAFDRVALAMKAFALAAHKSGRRPAKGKARAPLAPEDEAKEAAAARVQRSARGMLARRALRQMATAPAPGPAPRLRIAVSESHMRALIARALVKTRKGSLPTLASAAAIGRPPVPYRLGQMPGASVARPDAH